MSGIANAEVREAIIRWLEGGLSQLRVVLGILHDHERLRGVAEATERECERLRHQLETAQGECAKLREEVHQLRSGSERHLKERDDIADALSEIMNHVLLRLRSKRE